MTETNDFSIQLLVAKARLPAIKRLVPPKKTVPAILVQQQLPLGGAAILRQQAVNVRAGVRVPVKFRGRVWVGGKDNKSKATATTPLFASLSLSLSPRARERMRLCVYVCASVFVRARGCVSVCMCKYLCERTCGCVCACVFV